MEYKELIKKRIFMKILILLVLPNIIFGAVFYNKMYISRTNNLLTLNRNNTEMKYNNFLNWYKGKTNILELISKISFYEKYDDYIKLSKLVVYSNENISIKEKIYLVDKNKTIGIIENGKLASIHFDKNNNRVLSLYKKTNVEGIYIAIDLLVTDIEDKINQYFSNDLESISLVISGNEIIKEGNTKNNNFFNDIRYNVKLKEYDVNIYDNENKINFFVSQKADFNLSRINQFLYVFKVSIVIAIITYLLVIASFFKILFFPIDRVIAQIDKILNGDMVYKINFKKHRYFTYIYESFNKLIYKLQDIYYKELEIDEEYKFLVNELKEKGKSANNIKNNIDELKKNISLEELKYKVFSESKDFTLGLEELYDSEIVDEEKYLKVKVVKRKKELQFIREVMTSLTNSNTLETLLSNIVERINKLSGRGICTIRLVENNLLKLKAYSGEFSEFIKKGDLSMEKDIAGEAIKKNQIVVVKDFKNVLVDYTFDKENLFDKIKEAIYIPLSNNNKAIGVIIIAVENKIDDLDIDLLKAFARHASIAIEKIGLYNELKNNYFNTIKVLITAVEAKDSYTEGHSIRVSKIAVLIAKEMGFSDVEIEEVEISGILHDIGKIGIEDKILTKEGKLTDYEYNEIKKHSEIGFRIIKPIEMSKGIIEGVLLHHLRYDKKGYPKMKTFDRTTIIPCIIGLSDAIDAITSNRLYSSKKDLKWAIDEINRNSGTQFNPKIVKIINKIFNKNASLLYDIIDEE